MAARPSANAIADGFGPVGIPLLTLAAAALAVRARKATPLAFVAAAGGGSLAMTLVRDIRVRTS